MATSTTVYAHLRSINQPAQAASFIPTTGPGPRSRRSVDGLRQTCNHAAFAGTLMNPTTLASNHKAAALRRRVFVSGVAALTASLPSICAAAVPTVGYISSGVKGTALDTLFSDAMQEGLAQQGYVAPKSLRWISRYRGEGPTDIEALTQELIRDGAELVLANGGATRAAIRGTAGKVPLIYGFSGDPVAAGLATGLARPQHNATGVSLMFVETNAKRIQIVKDLVPSMRRVALISSPNHPGEAAEMDVCRRTVASLGVEMLYLPVFNAADVEKALLKAFAARIDALVAPPDPVTIATRLRVAAWAIENRIPFASGWAIFADEGALMTYGPNVRWSYNRVGQLAAKVLAGAKTENIPIEQPTRFELVVNRRTARALGIAIPAVIAASADRFID